MRQADASGADAGTSPDGDTGRTIRTTLIPAPRLARRRAPTSPAADVGDAAAGAAAEPSPRSSSTCRWSLGVGDGLAVLFGFYFVISLVADVRPGVVVELIFQMVAVTGVGLFAIRSQGLWVSRFNAVRAIELSRITRAVVVMGLGTIVLDRAAKLYFHVEEIFVGCVAVWFVLVAWRSVYRTWLAAQRKAGHFVRRVDHRRHRPPGDGADRACSRPTRRSGSASSGSSARHARPGRPDGPTCGWPTTPTPTRCSTGPTSTASCCARATSTRRCSRC